MTVGIPHQRATVHAREFRRFGVSTIEVRAKDDTTEIDIEGYASVTGEPYAVTDAMGEYQETVEPGAFTKTLADKDDVRLLFNHEGLPLARTKSSTLALTEDKTGLKVEATLDTRSVTSNDLLVAVERGDVDEMSFAFKVVRQEWNDDYSERWIKEVKLFDVSAVTYPANPDTSIKLRAAEFLLNNLSADDAQDLIRRHQNLPQVAGTGRRDQPAAAPAAPAAAAAAKLALRRTQLQLVGLCQ